MKRNLTLLIILIALLSLAYYLEEYRVRVRIAKEINDSKIAPDFSFEQLTSIKTPLFEISKSGDKFVIKGEKQAVKKEKLKQYVEILDNLKIAKHIPKGEVSKKNRAAYFDNDIDRLSLSFGNKNVEILIGKKLDFDQSFYVEIKKGQDVRHAIVEDMTSEPTIYNPKEVYRSSAKYNRLKRTLYLQSEFFL